MKMDCTEGLVLGNITDMELPIEEVKKVANLAQIELTETEMTRLSADLSQTISYIDELAGVDASEVDAELAQNSQITGLVNSVGQDEVVVSEVDSEELLKRAPRRSGRYMVVPKVLNK